MKKVLDFTKVPLDKWVDLYKAAGDQPNPTSELGKAWYDCDELAWTEVTEESDIDRELAEKLHDLEGQAVLALPKEIQELLKKKAEFKAENIQSSGQKESERRNQG